MAHSKPLVATISGGIPEIIEDGVTGLLAPRCDPQALADRLLRLSLDARLRERMGSAGALEVRRRFDMRERVADLVELYGVAARERVPCTAEVRHGAML
jgi:colanic acid/amylovoran biosynthesis glycosyltransferase